MIMVASLDFSALAAPQSRHPAERTSGPIPAAELMESARIRRDALAYCIECRNPLVATEQGFQFCPYQRAGQHEKLRRALFEMSEAPVAAVVTLDRDAARWRRRRVNRR